MRSILLGFTFLPLFGGIALADCGRLTEKAAIFSKELSEKKQLISENTAEIEDLKSQLQVAEAADKPSLRRTKDAVESDLRAARKQYDALIGKIEETGEDIRREECSFD